VSRHVRNPDAVPSIRGSPSAFLKYPRMGIEGLTLPAGHRGLCAVVVFVAGRATVPIADRALSTCRQTTTTVRLACTIGVPITQTIATRIVARNIRLRQLRNHSIAVEVERSTCTRRRKAGSLPWASPVVAVATVRSTRACLPSGRRRRPAVFAGGTVVSVAVTVVVVEIADRVRALSRRAACLAVRLEATSSADAFLTRGARGQVVPGGPGRIALLGLRRREAIRRSRCTGRVTGASVGTASKRAGGVVYPRPRRLAKLLYARVLAPGISRHAIATHAAAAYLSRATNAACLDVGPSRRVRSRLTTLAFVARLLDSRCVEGAADVAAVATHARAALLSTAAAHAVVFVRPNGGRARRLAALARVTGPNRALGMEG
jgi:hypothetical protein